MALAGSSPRAGGDNRLGSTSPSGIRDHLLEAPWDRPSWGVAYVQGCRSLDPWMLLPRLGLGSSCCTPAPWHGGSNATRIFLRVQKLTCKLISSSRWEV